jgi:hypothetical protein
MNGRTSAMGNRHRVSDSLSLWERARARDLKSQFSSPRPSPQGRGRFIHSTFVLGLLVALIAPGPLSFANRARADEASAPRIVGLRFGFGGYFKVGYWVPVEVAIEGGSQEVFGQVELIVLDGDAVPSRVRPLEVEPTMFPAGEKVSIGLYAKIGQLKSDVTVNLRSGDKLLASRRFSTGVDGELAGIMSADEELIVTLGSPLSAEDQAQLAEHKTKIANVASIDQLPTEWFCYEGVDAVVLATGEEELGSQLAADGRQVFDLQLFALDFWVRMGGKLILGVGRHAEKVLAPEAPLSHIAPGAFEAMLPLRSGMMFETYAETAEPLETSGGKFVVQVPKLRGVHGKIEAYAGNRPRDLPLVVRAPHGFGEVVFLAADLDRPPLANWVAKMQLFTKLLRRVKSTVSDTDSGTLGQVTTLGFRDLSGQLKGALDQFAGVQRVPFWLVAVLVVAYIACIGPLDYFFVKRVLRRMEATWLTFSITVLIFSGGAYGLAYGLKGQDLRVNQVDIVDFDAASNLVRGTSWSNVFSPRMDPYDLSLRIEAGSLCDPPEAIFSWQGLPGTGFGGMNGPASNMPLFTEAYDFSRTLDRLERVPIAVWSTKAFVGRWSAQGAGQIEARLSDKGKLVGTLESHLNTTLEDAVLIYDRWAYPLHRLEPAQHIDIAAELDPQTVETYLRHVTVVHDRDISRPYDRASFDIPRIVEIMTAHELAGGERYTGLSNQYQNFVEVSGLVKNGRAVLIGRQSQRATELVRDGRSLAPEGAGQHWTFYRFVFPVEEN